MALLFREKFKKDESDYMFLTGKEELEKYTGLSLPTLKKLHREQGLPLVPVGGKWGLDIELFREWARRRSKLSRSVPTEKGAE